MGNALFLNSLNVPWTFNELNLAPRHFFPTRRLREASRVPVPVEETEPTDYFLLNSE